MSLSSTVSAKAASWAALEPCLAPMGAVGARAMFGGIGVFLDGVMFAMITSDGTVLFRVDATTQGAYEAAGSKPYSSAAKKKGMPYFRVPAAVMRNRRTLLRWAREAHAVAVAARR